MMRLRLAAAAVAAVCIVAFAAPAPAQYPPVAPMEVLACRFVEGKGPEDLDGLAAAFNEWMTRSGAPPYAATALMPVAHSAEIDFDLAWVGAWPSGVEMGRSMEHYFAHGAELGSVLGAVLACDANTNYAVLTVRGRGFEPQAGPMQVSTCTLRLGVPTAQALAAVSEWVEYTSRSGSSAAHWLLFPSYGERSDATYAFKWAVGYPSYEAFGRDYDEFNEGGGVDRYAELFDPLMRCDSPRLYRVRVIRAEPRSTAPGEPEGARR